MNLIGAAAVVTAGLAAMLGAPGCKRAVVEASIPKEAPRASARARQVRANGTIQAVRSLAVKVPQVTIPGQVQAQAMGQNSRLTLVSIVASGARVKPGDILAEFDRTQQLEAAREARAKFEDLSHQVTQKAAENRSEAEKRMAELKKAEADLAKARIELKKGPILAEVDRLKNEAKAESAVVRVESLKKIDRDHRIAEAAALRILELQTERQKVALERATSNAEKLVLKAPISGMVALENIWRNGSMGHAQAGDQLWTGQPLVRIFDPSQMEIRALIGEPDRIALQTGAMAMVFLDAYPEASFKARFEAASPVATSAIGSPIKNFTAMFRLEQEDPRLLPDLSAAVIIRPDAERP